MAWHGTEWHGMQCNATQWHGMEWHGMALNAMQCNAKQWHGMEWNGMQCNAMQCNAMAWHGMEWHGMAWNGIECNAVQCKAMAWNGMEWHAMQCNATQWHGMAWNGMAWHGMAWHGMAWHGIEWQNGMDRKPSCSHDTTRPDSRHQLGTRPFDDMRCTGTQLTTSWVHTPAIWDPSPLVDPWTTKAATGLVLPHSLDVRPKFLSAVLTGPESPTAAETSSSLLHPSPQVASVSGAGYLPVLCLPRHHCACTTRLCSLTHNAQLSIVGVRWGMPDA